jgi:hypothetical protein
MVNGKWVSEPVSPAKARQYRANMTDIFESRQAPGLHGDDTRFMNAFGTLDKQLGNQADLVVEAAKEQGYTPGINDVYMPSVARTIGDPEAFFHGGRGRADLKRTIEDNWGTASVGPWVETKNVERPPVETVPLAEDLIVDRYKEMVLENPDVMKRDIKEVREEIIQKHGGTKRTITPKKK